MKKFLAAALALILIVFSAQICAGAETGAEISVSSASAKPGDNVTVDVSVSNNPGINTFALGFEYNSAKLELKSVTLSQELGGQFFYSKKAVWLNSSDTYYNGKILELSFHVLDTASDGDAEIKVTFSDGEISNYNEDSVDFRSVPGMITVTGSSRPSQGTTAPSQTTSTTASTAAPASSTTTSTTTSTTSTAQDIYTSSSSTAASSTTAATTATSGTSSRTETGTKTTSTVPSYDPSVSIANVVRIDGTDRIGTALAISQRGWHSAKTVIVANAYNYPDALAGAALSKLRDAPILLTDSAKAAGSVLQEIRRLEAEEIIILGGTAAVSKQAENDLSRTGAKIIRLAGDNRNGTAARIAGALTDRSASVFLVNNNNFADALSVSSIAAIMGYPILYISPDGSIPAETGAAIQSLGCVSAYIIGGSAAISTDAESNLRAVHVTAERIAGDDRYLTSLAVCERFSEITEEGSAALATGKNFPDALAGAAFAAKKNIPVILVGDAVANEFKAHAEKRRFRMVYAFGGKSAVPDYVLYDVSEIMTSSSDTESFIDWLLSCGK